MELWSYGGDHGLVYLFIYMYMVVLMGFGIRGIIGCLRISQCFLP